LTEIEATAVPQARSLPVALLVAVRPRQWVKNVLVFAAAGAAGLLHEESVVIDALSAFVCFCLVSAGTYLVNDAGDIERDRRHPTKRDRPIARGEISRTLAYGMGVACMLAGSVLGLAVRPQLAVVLVAYLVLTTSYSLYLKHVAVVDIAAIATGFVLRAVAGGAATDIAISNWFFIVTCFGSLFVVVGKRHAEAITMADAGATTRSTLASYTPTYLSYLRAVSSGVVLVAYCLWSFEKSDLVNASVPWFQMTILPFTCALLRYAQLVDRGEGGAPEDVLLADRALQILGTVWVATFTLGVYLSPRRYAERSLRHFS